MKKSGAEVGRRMSFPSWASRLASGSALAALALIAVPAAKADVVETFDLSGSFLFPAATFTGTVDLDFTNNTATSVDVTVYVTADGLPAYNQSPSLFLISGGQAVLKASNSTGDVLTLMFTVPHQGTLKDFTGGTIAGSEAGFGGTCCLFDPKGFITPDPSNPVTPATAPEPSTWAMMLLGFIGLGLAAKGRRAIRFLAGKA
jgi:hypothetical protein